MLTSETGVYLISTGLIGIIIIWIIKNILKKLEAKQISAAKESNYLGGVRRKSPPFMRGLRKMREEVVHDLAIHFSVIRRTFLVLGVLLWLFIMLFPFMREVSATFVSLIAGALAVICGIAARPFVENLISGIVISFSRKLQIGDTIEIDKQYGTVQDISMTHTTVKLWDWRKYMIPNSQMLNTDFVNYSTDDLYLWSYIKFWVSPDVDIKLVREIALKAVESSSESKSTELPRFWVMEMDKESIKCWVAGWADSPANAWRLKSDVRQKLMVEFNNHGIRTHSYNISQ